jgi:hypothetical protein
MSDMSNNTWMRGRSDKQGLGSVRRELSERTTLKIDSAGDQLFFRMSIQTFPFSEIFMWYMLEMEIVSEQVASKTRRDRTVSEIGLWGLKIYNNYLRFS